MNPKRQSPEVDPAGGSAPAAGTPDGTPATPVAPAVEPQTPPVEPVTPNDGKKSNEPSKSQREIELEQELEAERSKTREARSDAEKKRKQRAETMRQAGEFESLYTEAQQELAGISRERDTLSSTLKVKDAELKTLRTEVDGYRASMVERFDEQHRGLTEGVPLAKLPELYEALHKRPLFQQAPPSPGANRVAGNTVPPQQDNRFGKSRMASGYKTT